MGKVVMTIQVLTEVDLVEVEVLMVKGVVVVMMEEAVVEA